MENDTAGDGLFHQLCRELCR